MKHLLPIAAPLFLAACASTSTPNYDMRFGDAVREARQRQTLNPNAAAAPTVQGVDGRTAQDSMVLYRNTYKTPPPVVNVINIGGSTSGSAR